MECGKWQLLSAFLLCCIQLPITFSDQLLRCCARTPPHRCRVPASNSSFPPPRPVIFVEGRPRFASCELYVDPEDLSLGTQHCTHGWEFLQDDPDEWTLVTEWDLVCEREYLMNLLPYAYTGGTMLGGILFGILGDHYGRRSNLLAALLFHTVFGLALHFCSLFTIFAIGYSLQGMLVTAIQCLSYTLLLETVSFQYHLKSSISLCFVTPVGIIILCIISWLIKNWRYIQLAISAPGIVCLGYFWLIPRSFPWLLAEGYVSEAEKQMIRISRFNKVLLPLNFRIQLSNFCKRIKSFSTGSNHSLETVVCSEKIRTYTFILYYMWFVVSLDTEALSSELPALKNNKYASLLVKGLMDIGMLILLYFFALRFGPRSAQAFHLTVGGFQCIGSAVLAYFSPFQGISELLSLLSPVLSVVGKACIRSVLATNIFFTVKVFPTGVRGIGLGSCLFWTRAAHLIGIHISTLEVESAYHFPRGVCGCLAIIGGLLTFFLPPNCNRPLPNVAIEVEKSFTLSTPPERRQQPIASLHPQEDIHSEEEQENEKNNTILELSVHEFHCSDLTAGPSHRICHTPSSRLDKDDTESRLTDLEEELGRIWDLNAGTSESSGDPLRQFRHTDEVESAYHFPRGVCGCLAIIGGLLTFFLPPNCNRPLPNVAIEVEKSFTLSTPPERRQQPIASLHPQEDIHSEEEQENEKNNTILELSVHEFHCSDLTAGPSHRICHTPSSRLDKDDTESRLTDLEEELGRIWDLNAGTSESSGDPLRQFRHTDVREHYLRMNETQF